MATSSARSGATPAIHVLEGAGVSFVTRSYRHDPAAPAYGLEAAAALGEPPERVFKTLLVQTDLKAHKGLVVAIVPVARQLDLKALARTVGTKNAALADPKLAERTTGYVVGGISPLGQRTALQTVLDASAADHDQILVSGGRRGLDVELAPGDLRRLTGADLAPIAR